MLSDTAMIPEEHADQLRNALSLASLFSTCVETFGLIHPSKGLDYHQNLALTRLGIQQGRLLIFGSVVGISSPPVMIATHAVPSHAGSTNPDPTSPIYFEPRDERLDEPEWKQLVEATLNEIVDRPAHFSREEMMELYGLKPPKRLARSTHPTLDDNRLEAFYEKYALLEDLLDDLSVSRDLYRTKSITAQHWQIHDVNKFSAFVTMVRDLVDKLIEKFGCKERIDRGIKSDIRAFGWHPEMPKNVIRKDADKLNLIMAMCKEDYPEYIPSTKIALDNINQELREGIEPWPVPAPNLESVSIPNESNQKKEEMENGGIDKEKTKALSQPSAIPEMETLTLDTLAVSSELAQTNSILKRTDALNNLMNMFGELKKIGRVDGNSLRLETHVM